MEAYLGLFATSFLAATVLPAQSELLLAGLLSADYPALPLWIWASAGNTLGAAVNWAMARYLLRFRERRWFPFPELKLVRAQRWFRRYGVWTLLFAWLPIVGDALTFVAGLMGVRFPLFLLLTFIGKAGRYGVLVGLWASLSPVTG
jgi:membrane protein YqaA with SNARE-associated domain